MVGASRTPPRRNFSLSTPLELAIGAGASTLIFGPGCPDRTALQTAHACLPAASVWDTREIDHPDATPAWLETQLLPVGAQSLIVLLRPRPSLAVRAVLGARIEDRRGSGMKTVAFLPSPHPGRGWTKLFAVSIRTDAALSACMVEDGAFDGWSLP